MSLFSMGTIHMSAANLQAWRWIAADVSTICRLSRFQQRDAV